MALCTIHCLASWRFTVDYVCNIITREYPEIILLVCLSLDCCGMISHSISRCLILQHGSCYQQQSETYFHYLPASVVILQLKFCLAGPVAPTYAWRARLWLGAVEYHGKKKQKHGKLLWKWQKSLHQITGPNHYRLYKINSASSTDDHHYI